MKVKEFIYLILLTLFLSSLTGLSVLPENLTDFLLATFGSFVFWSGMFSGAIMDCFD